MRRYLYGGMTMSNLDLAGEWEYLGTVTPKFDIWTPFPTITQAGNSLVRATYYGNFPRILSVGYLRASYRFPETVADRNWIKLFPKEGREAFSCHTPQEILMVSGQIDRQFEIMKLPRRYPKSTLKDDDWSIGLEVLTFINLLPEERTAILEGARAITTTSDVLKAFLLGE